MNTFGDGHHQFGLVDPRSIRADRSRFRRDALPMLERANSLYIPSGRYATRGWILLPRYEYAQLNTYSTSLQLNIGQDNLPTLGNLSIVHAQCVTRGLASDPNAIYLIELTDDRGILSNQWMQCPTTSFYNIRAPAYPQTFYPASTNGGPSWTWATMLQDLWQQMNTLGGGGVLGAWPGLSLSPSGTPEGFDFPGVPAWTMLNDVLEHLGMNVVCDLTKANPFTIVNSGATDASFTALQALHFPPEDDMEWIDTGAGRTPGVVKVLFRRRNSIYGTEETVRYDSPYQWEMNPFYEVSVNAPVQFAAAVGVHYLWSDFTVRYDMDSSPLTADTTTAATIAAERVTQYFAKIYRQTAGYLTQTYAGALPFVTGSQVDGVRYYQDYSSQNRQGWKTQIIRGAMPPWPELWDLR